MHPNTEYVCFIVINTLQPSAEYFRELLYVQSMNRALRRTVPNHVKTMKLVRFNDTICCQKGWFENDPTRQHCHLCIDSFIGMPNMLFHFMVKHCYEISAIESMHRWRTGNIIFNVDIFTLRVMRSNTAEIQKALDAIRTKEKTFTLPLHSSQQPLAQ